MNQTLEILIYTVILGTVLGVFFLVFHQQFREPLTIVNHLLLDKKNKHILHIIGARIRMPEDGDNITTYHHYAFDIKSKKLILGGKQVGDDIDLDSEFIKRTTENLKSQISNIVEIDKKSNIETFDSEIYHIKESQSDTEKLPTLSPNRYEFQRLYKSIEKSNYVIRIYRNNQLVNSIRMNGDCNYFFHSIYIDSENYFCFTYNKQVLLKTGMALCIINHKTGNVVYNEYLR